MRIRGDGGQTRASVWLKRNGGGDMFKPRTQSLVLGGGAPGVPRISLHYLTI